MASEYSFSEFEDNLCSKMNGSCLEDLEYEYYINTLVVDNELANELTADHVNFDFEKDGNNMPKALKTIECLKKQNHNLRSRLMILTRDVPFMKALTSDQKVKLIIKLRLHLEKLIRKYNQTRKYKKDDQISEINGNSTRDKNLINKNVLNNAKEEMKNNIKEESLSLQINSQVERLLVENKYLRDKIENLEKCCDNKNKEFMLVKTEFNIKIDNDKQNFTTHQINDINNVKELKYHVIEMRKCYDELMKKHLTATKALKFKDGEIIELKKELNQYKNDKKNNYQQM